MTANAKLQIHAVFVFQKEEDKQEAKDWPITKGVHFEMLRHNPFRPVSAKLECTSYLTINSTLHLISTTDDWLISIRCWLG